MNFICMNDYLPLKGKLHNFPTIEKILYFYRKPIAIT